MADEKREPSEIVEAASAVGGALAGTAVTFVAGPWVGSASGEAVARVLLHVGSEIERWILGPRQERRIGRAAQVAYEEIQKQLEEGHQARSDGFFNAHEPDGGSPAEELFEGVLRTAADEWEQRKVAYIGRIFGRLSFDPTVSPAQGAYLIKLSERLTYRQVVLLAFWEAAQDSSRPYEQAVIMLGIDQTEGGESPDATLLAEMNDLASSGLLGIARGDGQVVHPGATVGGLESFGTFGGSVDLNTVRLTRLGKTLYELMGLEDVADPDLDSVLSGLRGS